jgi:protein-serine/threonine kinase
LISNPLSKSSSKFSTSLIARLSNSRRPSVSSVENGGNKLTEPMPNQSTPPQTPRTRSQEAKPPTAPPTATNTPTKAPTKSIRTEGTTIGPVLGKLTVDISEGRGLKPSYDPYVVCEFQLSQYISEGPSGEKENKSGSTSKDGLGRIVIRPASSEQGRPMAIPMRSRQSSSSGRDPQAQQEVVNPKWDHRAVL